jgi:hypothetical protein
MYPQGVTNWDVCQQCKFYIMIDSGYGHCRRFPPIMYHVPRLFRSPIVELCYPIVPWNMKACGEQRQRKES